MKTLGTAIRNLRQKLELTQRALAHKSGVSFNTIVNLELGANPNPTLDILLKITRALNTTLDVLVSVAPDSSSSPFINWYQRKLPPLPILLLENAYTKNFERVIQDKWQAIIHTLEHGVTSLHFATDDFTRLGNRSLDLAKKDKQFIVKLNKKLKLLMKPFLAKTNTFETLNYKKTNNDKLAELFKRFCNEYESISIYGEVVPFCLEVALTKKLKNLLERQFPGITQEERDQIFTMLSSPYEISFVAREEKDLYSIALLPASRQMNALRNHTRLFSWVPFDYIGPAWDFEYFHDRFQRMTELSREEVKNKTEEMKNRGKHLEKQQQQIIEKYNLPSDTVFEFKLLQQCSWQFDQKKELLTQAHYNLSFLLKEIASRLKIEFSLIYYALPQEIVSSLKGKKIINNYLLGQRQKHSVLISEEGVSRFVSGVEEQEWLARIQKDTPATTETTSSVAGMVAYPGKIKGTASVILSPRHIADMHQGDILITTMTSVDFVPAMRMASAIITDIGGITSHAAIVSRELKIPCIVGTKNATKIFQTGDEVIVDGEKGIVSFA